jgi:hypothetical protein
MFFKDSIRAHRDGIAAFKELLVKKNNLYPAQEMG